MATDSKLRQQLKAAVRHFWLTRESQAQKQGMTTGVRDAGQRSAVTGGAQMDGFVTLIRELLCNNGLPSARVFCQQCVELPGWYRPEKKWDLLVVSDGQLLLAIEFKSQVGPSFGNNYNNRTEEALGSATDILAAYREGAFSPSQRPWLGYLMLLEESPESTAPVRAREPHFKVFGEFRNASYAKRYELLLTKMMRERLYDSACLLLSNRASAKSGDFREPSSELTVDKFIASLLSKVIATARARH